MSKEKRVSTWEVEGKSEEFLSWKPKEERFQERNNAPTALNTVSGIW